MSKSDQERRQFTRFPFDGTVSFNFKGEIIQAKLIDISLQGALIELEHEWTQGIVHELHFDLHLNEQAFSVQFEGSIVHIEGKLVGISCEFIDIDSASHLKRLVELNLGDTLLLARELSAMC